MIGKKGGFGTGTNRMTFRPRASGTIAKASLALAVALAALAVSGHAPAMAAKEDRVFTIGNYPVEARASDAVAAKEKAISEGQQAALKSLLKRLAPVTAYKRLRQLKVVKAGDMVESFAVRSERNSSTDYIASYDFVFSPEPVRKLLEREGIPYLDRQAPQIIVVPAYRVSPEAAGRLPQTFGAAAGSDAWLYAWKGLDLANTLTPISLQPLKKEVHADTIKALAEGDLGYLKTIGGAYQSETVVVAVLEPEPDLKKLKIVLVGRDAVQNLYLKRHYRLDGQDLAYTAELAAIVSLAILEGRWKAINVREGAQASGWSSGDRDDSSARASGSSAAPASFGGGAPAGDTRPGGPVSGGNAVTIAVQFRGMVEWQEISRQLAQTPEIADLEVLGLSANRARVSLVYPGGPADLAVTLAGQGLILQQSREGWLLTRR